MGGWVGRLGGVAVNGGQTGGVTAHLRLRRLRFDCNACCIGGVIQRVIRQRLLVGEADDQRAGGGWTV